MKGCIFRPAFGCTHIVYFHQLSSGRYSKVLVLIYVTQSLHETVFKCCTLQTLVKIYFSNVFNVWKSCKMEETAKNLTSNSVKKNCFNGEYTRMLVKFSVFFLGISVKITVVQDKRLLYNIKWDPRVVKPTHHKYSRMPIAKYCCCSGFLWFELKICYVYLTKLE